MATSNKIIAQKLKSGILRAAYPFSILSWRNFALVWSSSTSVAMGTQMEAVVLGWYVLTLTDSPFLVGLISAARMALNFLALFAGAIVDRLPRHKVLAAVEFTMTALGLLMLGLIVSDLLEVWHIFAITLAAGMVRIFQTPSAQSLVADTLPKDRIANGAAFTTLGMNFAVIIGPLVGGVLFKTVGPEGAYIVIASFYCVSGLFALSVRVPQGASLINKDPVIKAVIQGLKYVKGQQVLWAALMLAVVINLTGWTFHTSLMPVFARDVLETDSAGLGLLLFAFGLGAFTGSAIWASIPNLRHVGKMLIMAAVLWHASILVFAASDDFRLSIGILAFTGLAWASTQTLLLTLLLRTTEAEFRGRVMGLRVLAIYAFSFGSVAAGAIAGIWGAPWAANIVGMVGIALIFVLVIFTPKLRRA